MDETIIISNLNDFIFCPASIYFHSLYGSRDTLSYQNTDQIKGSNAHMSIDENTYSTRKDIITSLEIYSEKYDVVGKIDIYDNRKKTLIERKRLVKNIYDGYVFQLYAQYFGLMEMGYEVKSMYIHSIADNKKYPIPLPENNSEMYEKFCQLLYDMRHFNLYEFVQTNSEKCGHCIYEPACDRGLNRC